MKPTYCVQRSVEYALKVPTFPKSAVAPSGLPKVPPLLHKNTGRVIGIMLAVLSMAGCAHSSSAGVAGAGVVSAPVPTEAPFASEAQVASVIARYDVEFRTTTKGAFNCRLKWIFTQGDGADPAGAANCWSDALTVEMDAASVTDEWDNLKIPTSMIQLVDDTTTRLNLVASADLASVCGSGDVPERTDECDAALRDEWTSLRDLVEELDAWKPYY